MENYSPYDVFERFNRAEIARDEWHHLDHLVVGYIYLERFELNEAKSQMRNGIFRLISTFNLNPSEMPYHETLTMFWMHVLSDFRETTGKREIGEIIDELRTKFDKDYPLQFYSRDELFSDEARQSFIMPKRKTVQKP